MTPRMLERGRRAALALNATGAVVTGPVVAGMRQPARPGRAMG